MRFDKVAESVTSELLQSANADERSLKRPFYPTFNPFNVQRLMTGYVWVDPPDAGN